MSKNLEYITFNLNEIEYAIPLINIKKIFSYPKNITRLPKSENFMDGFINSRGEIYPIFDLRTILNMEKEIKTEETSVLIVVIKNKTIGLVVDKINDTKNIEQNIITDIPEIVNNISNNYIDGLVKEDNKIIILLNIQEILKNNGENNGE